MNPLRDHLLTLHIGNLVEWDVLAFIQRHGTYLASTEQIAKMLGHGKLAVAGALDLLTSTGLVRRSRSSRGARLYRLAPAIPGDPRQRALEDLMETTEDRHGRLLLTEELRQSGTGRGRRERGGLHLA